MSNNPATPVRDTFCVVTPDDSDGDHTSLLNIRCQERWKRHAVFVEDGTMLSGTNTIFLVTCILPNGFNVTVRDASKKKARRAAARLCLDECDDLQTEDERVRRETLRRNVAMRLHAVAAGELPTAGGKEPVVSERLNQRSFPTVPPLAAYFAARQAGEFGAPQPGQAANSSPPWPGMPAAQPEMDARKARAMAARKIFETMNDDDLLALIR